MSSAETTTGAVFNIQPYSIHDGPGIRTTVFLCGCPLDCAWCQNPECRQSPIPAEWKMTAQQVFERVAADRIFYEESGGGMTLSGGEPLTQPEFSASVLALCRAARIHTAVDTCGHAPWPVVKDVVGLCDLVLYDLKHMDSAAHARLTGVSNDLILDNARRIHHELCVPMRLRVPVIPGANDTVENLRAVAEFTLNELGRSVPVHLIPYHKLGSAKWEKLGKRLPLDTAAPSDERMSELKELAASFGLAVSIGG